MARAEARLNANLAYQAYLQAIRDDDDEAYYKAIRDGALITELKTMCWRTSGRTWNPMKRREKRMVYLFRMLFSA